MQCIPTCSPGSTPLRGLSSGVDIADGFFSQSGVELKIQDGGAPERKSRPSWKTAHQPRQRTCDWYHRFPWRHNRKNTWSLSHKGVTTLIKFSLTLIRYESNRYINNSIKLKSMQINKQIQCPTPKQHKATWCATVVTRMDTLKSGWTYCLLHNKVC